MQHRWLYVKNCENNSRPRVKIHMSFCACAKSRDLLRMPECLIAVVLVDVDLPIGLKMLSTWSHLRLNFSNICTPHTQKRLFMNFRCIFRHGRSIRLPRFPIRVQNFGDLATFSVDFCILYAAYPLYFYFRFVWPTDLESVSQTLTPTSIILTKFEVDMTIHCRVIAFLSADTSRDLVTLTTDLLILNSCPAWRVTWPTLPPNMKTLHKSALKLWVITFPVG